MPDHALSRKLGRILAASRYPSTVERLARVTDAPEADVLAALSVLLAAGDAAETDGLYSATDSTPKARPSKGDRLDLTDGERIARGLGTTWAPLPMGPGLSPNALANRFGV